MQPQCFNHQRDNSPNHDVDDDDGSDDDRKEGQEQQHASLRVLPRYHGLPLSWGGSHSEAGSILAEIDASFGDEQAHVAP